MVPLHAGCERKGTVLFQLLSPTPGLHASVKGAQSVRNSTFPGTAGCPDGKHAIHFTASSPALCLHGGDADLGLLSPLCFPHRLSGSSPGSDRAKSYPRQKSWGCSLAGCHGQGPAARAAACSLPLAPRGSR